MTGTPVANLATDVFGIYKWLDESIFGSSRTAFIARYAYTQALPNGGSMILGMREHMMSELTAKVHSIAHRASKESALDLPDTVDVDIPITLGAKAMRAYRELKAEAITFLESGEVVVAQHVLTRLLRLQQIAGGYAKDAEGWTVNIGSEKLDALRDIYADEAGKLVVFCRFSAEVRDAYMLAEKQGLCPVVIEGSVTADDRTENIHRFQTDDDCRVLVAQIQAASTGITLTAANHCVFYSTGYGLAEYEQAKARVHRIGQASKVTYTHLVAAQTVDEAIIKALREKKHIADLIENDKWKDLL